MIKMRLVVSIIINNKKDLKYYIKEDIKYYYKIRYNIRNRVVSFLAKDNEYMIKKYIILLRKTEFYLNNSYYKTKNKYKLINDILYLIYYRRKNCLGRKLGIEINENSFDSGLTIYHGGNIVVNQNAKIGKNCILHGCNCIGNDGKSTLAPIIGHNVKIGVGASIIGGITIADNVKIGAGAVVIHSVENKGATIVGIPGYEV